MSGNWWDGFMAGVLFSVGVRELGVYVRARRSKKAAP